MSGISDFMTGNVGKASANLMPTVPTNLIHVNMCYNLNGFVCSILQTEWGFRASFHQLTKFPTNIDRQTWIHGTFASMCNRFQNKSPTRIFAPDWDISSCFFNGASPTGSPRWGHRLQRRLLACERLYGITICIMFVQLVVIRALLNILDKIRLPIRKQYHEPILTLPWLVYLF